MPRRAWKAQTLANTYLAIDHHLTIVPILNKIDLPGAEVERVKEQLESIIGIDPDEAILISAKSGLGVEEVLEAIVLRIPPPTGDTEAPLKALLFDSWFDPYRGVIIMARLIDDHYGPPDRRLCPQRDEDPPHVQWPGLSRGCSWRSWPEDEGDRKPVGR